MRMFRILLAEDHPVFRMGVCSLIRSHEGWDVCGEAADGREAVKQCMQLRPDLLLLDICMPLLNGLDAARQILKHNPEQKILVLIQCRVRLGYPRMPGSRRARLGLQV